MSDSKPPQPGLTYSDAGVDIDAQDRALDRIKRSVASTRTAGVLSELGSFGGLFRPPVEGMGDPVLVASADGIGTKLKVAFETGVHDTVGRDLVNHCVNDILVQGARPLFFMDYVATGRLAPDVVASVVEGIAAGCRENGCALLGGELAEMPGFYKDGEYDVAGFIVGLVDRKLLIDGGAIEAGHVIVGLPSAGLHTNGFSLARKIVFEVAELSVHHDIPQVGPAGEVLLAEHRSYLPQLDHALQQGWVRGLAHITGGGLTDNLPRILPDGLSAEIHRDSWPVPPLFSWLQRTGRVDGMEMYRTFNMGIGMCVVCDPDQAVLLECRLDRFEQPHHRIGQIVPGDGSVRYV